MNFIYPISLGVVNSKCKSDDSVEVDGDGSRSGERISSTPEPKPVTKDIVSQLSVEESDLGIEVVIGASHEEESEKADTANKDGCQVVKEINQDPLSFLPPSFDRNCLNFPFFTDQKTIKHISKGKSKIMFIMRGLSGSGKSTIVQTLKSAYRDSVVCSADDYFLNEDGEYVFDVEKLGNAHGYSQNKAKTSCQNGTSVVIIDNTNVKRWEMKCYLSIANLFGYAVILVEPKTVWKFNPEELALRNKHGVPLDVLTKKVNSFDHVIPMYYGWFLSHKKSDLLRSLSSKIFAHCVNSFPAFRSELLSQLGIHRAGRVSPDMANEILLEYYSDQGKTSPLLHCTSRFCGAWKASGGKKYDSRTEVQSSCGRVFQLTLTGLVMTTKTCGVRVTLNEKCISLFDRPEEANWDRSKLEGGNDANNSEDVSATGASSLVSPGGGGKKKINNKNKNEESLQKLGMSSKRLKKRLAKEKKKAELEKWFNTNKDDNDNDDFGDDNDNGDGGAGVKDECIEVDDEPASLKDGSKPTLSDLMDLKLSEKVNKSSTPFDFDDHDNGGEDDDTYQCDNSKVPNSLTVDSNNSSLNLNRTFPQLRNSGFARSAHITIQTAKNVQSVETNLDILRACDIEHSRCNDVDTADLISVPKGKAVHYGDGVCCVYFDQPIKMDAVFSGYY